MQVPIDGFPRYFLVDKKLLAFTGKDKMYKVEPIGSNKNDGITIDYYTTRKMVLKHWPMTGHEYTREQFKRKISKLYKAFIDRITEEI